MSLDRFTEWCFALMIASLAAVFACGAVVVFSHFVRWLLEATRG